MTRGADLILTGGKIVTVDPQFRLAEALAVTDGRISAVGKAAEVLENADQWTKVVDLEGRTVVPGLIDGHAHLDREGLKGVFPSLGPTRSIADVQVALAHLVECTPVGEWIVTMPLGDPPAYRNVEALFSDGRLPNRHDLDAVAPDHPVYIRAIWGYWRHSTPLISIANTKALQAAGIDASTASPAPEVTIERDEEGFPTGVFREETLMPIVELAFFREATGFAPETRAKTLPTSVAAYHRYGTTSVFEGHGAASELIQAYRSAHASGELKIRTTLAISPNWKSVPDTNIPLFVEAWCGWLSGAGIGDDFLRIAGLFADIDPSPSNAVRASAYPRTGWAGFNYDTALSRERAIELLTACARQRIQVIAIWPNMLELFYEVHKSVPLTGLRWVFSHISLLNAAQVEMIREMGLIVTTHTNRYIYKEGQLLLERVGKSRENEITPLRTLVEAGVPVVLATDNVPVSLFHPFWHVVARRTRTDGTLVAQTQALPREQALRAITSTAALLTWDEDKKGTIEVGKLADLAVLDHDPLTCPEDQLPDIQSVLTVVGGEIVYASMRV